MSNTESKNVCLKFSLNFSTKSDSKKQCSSRVTHLIMCAIPADAGPEPHKIIIAKTTKTLVSTAIPVVGKALSDATDSIIGAASITKNALGIVGIIAIIGIVCVPIIKALIMMFVFNISSALIEPIVDKRMSKCVGETAESIKIIFGLMTTVSILFIIAMTLMLKISNFTLMYK